MGKWYRSNIVKSILIVLAVAATAVMASSCWWYGNNVPSMSDMVPSSKTKQFEDTETFAEEVYTDGHEILDALEFEKQMAANEGLNKDSYVDVESYYKKGELVEAKEEGLAYKLGELENWQSDYETYYDGDYANGDYDNYSNYLLVCETKSEGYDYLYINELADKIVKKELYAADGYEFINDMTLDDIEETLLSNNGFRLKDAEGEIVYTSFWSYDGYIIDEEYKPKGYDSLVDMVNENPKWNGRLDEAYKMVNSMVTELGQTMSDYENTSASFKEGDTNLTYLYYDEKHDKVYSNIEKYRKTSDLEKNIENLKNEGKYVLVTSSLKDFETNINYVRANAWSQALKGRIVDNGAEDNFKFFIHIDTKYPISDGYKEAADSYKVYSNGAGKYIGRFIGFSIVLLISLIWLCNIAGRRREDEEVHLNFIDKIFTEVAAALVIGGEALILAGFGSIISAATYVNGVRVASLPENHFAVIVLSMLAAIVGIIGLLSLARRIKAKTMWSGSLLKRIIGFFSWAFSHIHLIWKWVLVFLGFVLLHWIAIGSGNGVMVMFALVAEVAVAIYLVRFILGQEAIYKGLREIANGNLEYKIPYKHLKGNQFEIAAYINNIGDGFEKAIDVSMKSERMKTDLITNVSHDLKTPLTSIINYAGLLKQEHFTDPKINKYIDIIEEKALRLKTLTEDVVEASKATSGNIKLDIVELNYAELIRQASGEFAQKLEQRNLTEVLELPEAPIIIRADAKETWRILENIYTNVTKYGMPGTRVYSQLKVEGEEVIFNLKNISEEELNITPEELTERFIRGDRSRSKEGSGLGLSIAKSLTQMQGGIFKLELDGDLFKVSIMFPLAK